MTIGSRLKQWREYTHLNQEEASSLLGTPYSTLQKYEMDISKPGADAIIRFIDAGINATWLLKGIGPMLVADCGTKPVESDKTPVKRERTGDEAIAESPVDLDRLQRAIKQIKEELRRRNGMMATADEARVIVLAYALLEEEEQEKARASNEYAQKMIKLIKTMG